LIKTRGANMLLWFPAGSEPPEAAAKSWLDSLIQWFLPADNVSIPNQAESHAKHIIWTEWAKFQEAHSKFSTAADRMMQTAQRGAARTSPSSLKRSDRHAKAVTTNSHEDRSMNASRPIVQDSAGLVPMRVWDLPVRAVHGRSYCSWRIAA